MDAGALDYCAFPEHRIYIEPFGGAASVLLRKKRSYAEIYNDLDGEVVNLFRILREPQAAGELERMIRYTPFARDEFLGAYEYTDDRMEQARRLVIRAFMGFGSNAHTRVTGFRASSNRSGTTPAHDWANWPDAIKGMTERLAGVVIENRLAIDVIRHHDAAGALIYCDPPYVHETRCPGQLKNYNYEMTNEQHAELADVLRSVQGAVVLSGYRCDLYDSLYSDWRRIDKNAFADGARSRTESLWINNRVDLSRQHTLFKESTL